MTTGLPPLPPSQLPAAPPPPPPLPPPRYPGEGWRPKGSHLKSVCVYSPGEHYLRIVLKVAKSPYLRAFARATGVTVTWFWGIGGTVIPYEKKIVSAMGRPLGIPHIPEPTVEDIDKYHALYVSEVQVGPYTDICHL
eukprot:1191410-Prorocentrum_minimum.AAC.1